MGERANELFPTGDTRATPNSDMYISERSSNLLFYDCLKSF